MADDKPAPIALDPSALTPLDVAPAPPAAAPAPVEVAPAEVAPAPVDVAPAAAPEVPPEAPAIAPAEGDAPSPEASSGLDDAAHIAATAAGGKVDLQPLDVERWIPEKLRKNVDPSSPEPARMMAARAMVPMGAKEMVHVVYQSFFDANKKIGQLAKKTFKDLDDKILDTALSEELAPEVLFAFSRTLIDNARHIETLLLNRGTPDVAYVHVAAHATEHAAISIVAGNQERLLRCHDIVRGMRTNNATLRSELDRAVDFLVREGIFLDDVPEFEDAFVRLGKSDMLAVMKKIDIPADVLTDDQHKIAEDLGVSHEELLLGTHHKVASLEEAAAKEAAEDEEIPSGRRKPLGTYPIPIQIKLAMTGDHALAIEAVSSNNRMVASAGIRNPRIKEPDVQKIARMRSLNDDVVRYICNNGDWTKAYTVKHALVQNPKTPLSLVMRWMPLLRKNDIKSLAKSKQVPSAVTAHAKKMMSARTSR